MGFLSVTIYCIGCCDGNITILSNSGSRGGSSSKSGTVLAEISLNLAATCIREYSVSHCTCWCEFRVNCTHAYYVRLSSN